MALNPDVVESVANSNFKNVADSPAFYTGMMHADSIAHQRAVNTIREKTLINLAEVDVAEAIAANKMTTGNDLGGIVASLGAAVASLQQLAKIGQTTPPPTA